MTDVRLSLPAVIAIVVIVGAAAFAAGRSTSASAPEIAAPVQQQAPPSHVGDPGGDLPPGHPPAGGTGAMPPGHPPIDDPAGKSAPTAAAEGSYKWTMPPRWKEAPNASAMRLATYKIPGPD